jgi:glutaredoxin 3
MKKIVMYTKKTCPYCDMAKNLFKQYFNINISDIEEIFIDTHPEKRDEMIDRSGRMTVPQIFIGQIHVGGFDDLAKLNREGELVKLLNDE